MSRVSRWFCVLSSVALAVMACREGELPGPTVGSESHFLVSCNASCVPGFECLCGVCTERCTAGEECAVHHPSAECVAVAERPRTAACPSTSAPAFCDVRCASAADCAGLGESFVCRAGFCREDPVVALGADGRIELAELCDFYVNDVCDAKIQCYGWNYRDREHCLRAQECEGWELLNRELAEGDVTFDPVATYQCHQRLLADPCAFGLLFGVPSLPAALRGCGALSGQLPAGAACETGAECSGELQCDTGEACPSTCQPRVANLGVGDACIPRICIPARPDCGPCAPGLVCYQDACRPDWVIGEACTTLQCGSTLWCDTSIGQCVRLAALGEACWASVFDGVPCEDGLFCDALSSAASGICRALSGEGGPCIVESNCVEPLTCLSSSTVAAAYGSCGAPQPLGQPCTLGSDCESGNCAADSRCAELPGPGDPCVDQCRTGAHCSAGSCVPDLFPGDACDGTVACENSLCAAGICTIQRRMGEPCSVSEECLSGNCVEGVCRDAAGCN